MENQNENEHNNIPLFPAKDHDMLVILHTLMQRVIGDIDKINDNMNERLITLENSKIGEDVFYRENNVIKVIQKDHETRLRRMEYIGFVIVGILFVVEFVLHYLMPR